MSRPTKAVIAQRQNCPHHTADLVKPGYQITIKDGHEYAKAKFRCTECGAWWIQEWIDKELV